MAVAEEFFEIGSKEYIKYVKERLKEPIELSLPFGISTIEVSKDTNYMRSATGFKKFSCIIWKADILYASNHRSDYRESQIVYRYVVPSDEKVDDVYEHMRSLIYSIEKENYKGIEFTDGFILLPVKLDEHTELTLLPKRIVFFG